MAMDYKSVASEIVEKVGGKENIASLTHCATRLRFKLVDESKANKDVVAKIKGVVNAIVSGGQFQVIIGNEVNGVFDEIVAQTGIVGKTVDVVEKDDLKVKGKFVDTVVDLVTSIFTPVLPALVGAGMVSALLSLATKYFGLSNTSGLYIVLNAGYTAVYSFLPVYLAYNAAKRFNVQPMVAVAVALAMVSPVVQSNVQSEVGMTIFGLPVMFPKQGYGSGVIPMIATVWFMSFIEKACKKIPAACRNILTPLIELVVTIPVMFLAIGPVFNYLQAGLGSTYKFLYDLSPIVCGFILGGAWQVLVVFGLHWGIVPLGQVNIAMYGRNTINAVTGPSNWSQAGAALGVALRAKNPEVKQVALSAGITGVFSITEPAIYGVNLKYKKPFYIAVGCAAISGAIAGACNAAATAGGPVGILSFPLFAGEGFLGFVIAMFFSLIGSCVLTYLFGYDKENDNQ